MNTQSPVAAEAAVQPELTIADLQNISAIIDAAVRRGAFGAAETTAVGATFDRLSAFLVAVTPAEPVVDTPEEEV